MRVRIYRLFINEPKFTGDYTGIDIPAYLEGELGIILPRSISLIDWREFFIDCSINDLLDSITILWNIFYTSGSSNLWTDGVSRIFNEEKVRYKLDDRGGVHFFEDAEFEFISSSTISRLGKPRYNAVRVAFEDALAALAGEEPDTKTALRSVFEANEILFKLMFQVQQLKQQEVTKKLGPYVARYFGDNQDARTAASQFVASFGNWVNGVHPYRHGQATEDPNPPPLPLTVALVSSGASYLRWLTELDQAQERWE
ncbi:hypothetical protein [Fodinicurvata fenggangensis]|uniref:hypothetical protein n=1 Tax=Fodinicurvata fenggangensis TaxID=1121830 RepID=UPI0012DF7DEE|nr:hypothetical protein [Fodinicurvata fenggangensis]